MTVTGKILVALLFAIPALIIVPLKNALPYQTAQFDQSYLNLTTNKETYRAVVIGGTGAVGQELVRQLLSTKHSSQVTVITRRKLSIEHAKLKNIVIENFDDIFNVDEDIFEGLHFDVAFSTLGTTIAESGEEGFIKVDLDYNAAFAKHCLKNFIQHFSLCSTLGASSESMFFYTRMKGLVENVIKSHSFKSISIFRPSLLLTKRKNERSAEKIFGDLYQHVEFIFEGVLRKYKPVKAADVAKVMRLEYEIRILGHGDPNHGIVTYENNHIHQVCTSYQ
ncbi:oxidoreductase [Acrasis kona]|uniref:Oxidoreductase n=1 Tax=Acrasis kona TaxID=1008807 RepID=A0AAW2ZMA4_9EUKA